MRVLNGKIENDVQISEDTRLSGMIVGKVVVAENNVFLISGMVVGDLLLRSNSSVKINGTINGDVINSGGHLEVYGIINGNLFEESGTTYIDKKAIVS
ncbi:hypothetical protein CSV67_02945 [Sporosarcina sp. P2]|uniref:hypothetical protein n=1 Tax=Sporosarcina sp. P2 TaxID=2048251 RepID=UPI000C16C34E|nr:hypothetical protein [Sporosarcina sp. P2]PID03614.1 hypothetical protein CSV67_02945 [Sporosarcina sp. P2]